MTRFELGVVARDQRDSVNFVDLAMDDVYHVGMKCRCYAVLKAR